MAPPVAVRAAMTVAQNPRLRRAVLAFAGGLLILPVLVMVGVLSYFAEADCNSQNASADFAGHFDGPGALGGVMGTGVTRQELSMARAHPYGGTAIVPHEYTSTAYAPAAGGINCGNGCGSTASGIRVNSGSRKAYLIASNPRQNKYGALVYAWPNPYGWKGPFVVADTGGNFDGSDGAYRVDFYIWGDSGEQRSNKWGRRATRLSSEPIVPGGPTETVDTTITGGDDDVASGESCQGGTETPPSGTTGFQGVLQWAEWLDNQRYPYCYGGGHVTPAVPTTGQYCWSASGAKVFGSRDKGYDCSSSTSFILQHAGYKVPTMVSGNYMSWGKPGPGRRVTIYANPEHVFLTIKMPNGELRSFSTSQSNYRHGPGFVPTAGRSTAGFVARHPEGL